MTAHEIYIKALENLRPTGSGWLSDYLQLWLEPQTYIGCWFSGENDKVRVWAFHVFASDVRKFKKAVPEAVKGNESPALGGYIFKVKVKRGSDRV